MKKFIVLLGFVIFAYMLQAQHTNIVNEQFTSIPTGWTVRPTSSWVVSNSLSVSSPSSVLGMIPNSVGDSVELISPWYDFTNYAYAFLQFSHICKVTMSDICQIKYQELSMPDWKAIPSSSYQGSDLNAFKNARFSHESYSIWMPGDSLAIPSNSWWKEEKFDISDEVSYAQVRFKFIIKKGSAIGSHFAYGWLIDNFKITASLDGIKPPIVEFIPPYPEGTVNTTGSFTVTAKVVSKTIAPIVKPIKLNVRYLYNSVTTYDTIIMTMLDGDSIYSAVIPQKVFGTDVFYEIYAKDTVGNDASVFSVFYIRRPVGSFTDSNSVALFRIDEPQDSVVAAPGHQMPVVVTIKNKGIVDLDSCYINWKLNDVVQQQTIWRGNIPSDFNATDTIGYYTPSLNKYDTIVVWTSNPNGVADLTTNDDTLTTYAFGVTGLNMYFTNILDTVYHTGPFSIIAHISSRTIIPVQQPIYMQVACIYNSITTYDSIRMVPKGNGLFEAVIPQQFYGSNVNYSITCKDALGNVVTINNGFYIKKIFSNTSTGYVTIGTDNTYQEVIPVARYFDYSWSRMLFLSSELSDSSGGGTITKLAWEVASTCPNATNQFCYFKEVSDTVISSVTYENPIAHAATLVWSGTLDLSKTGWVEMQLSTPFFLTPGKHLMVYWENHDGTFAFPHATFFATTTGVPMATADFADASFPNYVFPYAGGLDYDRPNARFFIIGTTNDSNSVALLSIDNPAAEVLVSPNIGNLPVSVTIKNKGLQHLTSCNVSWSLNGVYQNTKLWSGNLSEDFNDTITIGYYTPSAGRKDVITAWVSMPNGSVDNNDYDDTLSISVFGKTAAIVELSGPQDTVFSTGPFDVYAKIISLTSVSIDTNIKLKVSYSYGGVTTYDTIRMVNTGNDTLWTAKLNQSPFTSKITYAIDIVDSLGNIINIENFAYIKRPTNSLDSATIPSLPPLSGVFVVPFDCRYAASYSRVIYKNQEFGNITSSIRIGSVAWQSFDFPGYTYSATRTNQRVYFKEVSDTLITTSAYIDPVLEGYTLVWSGAMSLSATPGVWHKINLDRSFILHPDKNLIVYFIDEAGIMGSTFAWNYISDFSSSAYGVGSSLSSLIQQALSSYKPFTRFSYQLVSNDSNSVELTSILSPGSKTPAEMLAPVNVIITNKGMLKLDSCLINWTVNGQLQPQFVWKGSPHLFEQFSDTILLGSYIPTPNKTDIIIVWVSMPNGVDDLTKDDDTLTLKVFGNTGITAEFLAPFVKDTVNSIGEFEIKAHIKSLTSIPLPTPVLNVIYTYNNITTYDTIPMTTVVSDSLYKAIIPKQPYGTHVDYSITLVDSVGTTFSIADWFYTKRNSVINDSNSVALIEIISPTDTAQCFQLVPITVVIKNKGIKNLTSCNIEWSNNGIVQTSYQWTGNLAEDFIDTITIGTYSPTFKVIDKFEIWVSNPNGQLDPINNDDTLKRNAYGYYLGGNIVAKSIVSPINIVSQACFPEKTALKVRLENVGTKMVYFFTDPITFYINITGAVNRQIQKTINSGFIGVEEKEILVDSIDITIPGTYNIEVYYECNDDVIHTDDTLRTTYNVNIISFPYDNDFSNITNDYKITQSGTIAWEINTSPNINPLYGTGALHIGSAEGETSTLTFYPINISKSVYPTLEFWFAHNDENPTAQDKVLLKVSKNGGSTFTTLQTVYRYKSSATTPTWENYIVDLIDYASESCLIFALEAISEDGGEMLIDRIKINSNHEIAITDIDIKSLSTLIACDLSNIPLSVTLTNNTYMDFDFSETPVTVVIDVSGEVDNTYSTTIATGTMLANSNHTVIVENNFDYSLGGTYNFIAYINSIDKNPLNDTLSAKSITINPDVSVDSIVDKGCKIAGTSDYITIYIKNEGNIKVHNIPLRLQIDDANDLIETAAITLNPGQSSSYTFISPYIVPATSTYDLSVTAELTCDININNNKKTINCCIVEPSVKVMAILEPDTVNCDLINTYKYATIVLHNASENYLMYEEVYLIIDDNQGNVATLKDTALYLDTGITNYRFTKPYQVPNLAEGATYKLTSYIFAEAYGVTTHSCVKADVGIENISNTAYYLGQNKPNPAQSFVTIPYQIPEAGEIIFKLTTISGQVLYINKLESLSGEQELNLTTENLSNGIYYYSMEYKGRILVKKIAIQK